MRFGGAKRSLVNGVIICPQTHMKEVNLKNISDEENEVVTI